MILVGAALAGVVVGPALQSDRPAQVAGVGLDFALVAEHDRGLRPVGRVFGGPELFEGLPPLLLVEVGGLFVVPSEDDAVIRAGLVVRGMRINRTLPLPLQTERRSDNAPRFGLVPAVVFRVELEWTPEAPIVVGLEAGMVAGVSPYPFCENLDASPDRLAACSGWPAGVSASLLARKTFRSGLTLQASAGNHVMAAVGWAFRQRSVTARAGRSSRRRL